VNDGRATKHDQARRRWTPPRHLAPAKPALNAFAITFEGRLELNNNQ
jgi:hypothetical protein